MRRKSNDKDSRRSFDCVPARRDFAQDDSCILVRAKGSINSSVGRMIGCYFFFDLAGLAFLLGAAFFFGFISFRFLSMRA